MISQTVGAPVCGGIALHERLLGKTAISGSLQGPLHSLPLSRQFCRRRAEKLVLSKKSKPQEKKCSISQAVGVLQSRSQWTALITSGVSKRRMKTDVPSAATMLSETAKVGDIPNDWDDEHEASGMHAAGYHIYSVIMQVVEEQFGDQLQPCRTPGEIRYYKSADGSVKGDLPMRAGNGPDTWFLIQSRLGVDRPGMPGQPGSKMALWSVMMWLGPATDAPHCTFEISVSPDKIFLVADMVPRRDLVGEPDYLDEVYEQSGAKELHAKIKKDPRFTFYDSPDLYTHVALSPACICHTHALGQGAGESNGEGGSNGAEKSDGKGDEGRPVLAAMKEVVEPYVRGTLDNWIKVVKARARNIPPEEQEALSRRDKILKKEAVERDPGTAMLPMMLGPEVGNKIARALVEGEPRQLSLQQHFLYQRPHWRHWYGVFSKWDAHTGETLETYRMERNIEVQDPEGKKIHHKNTRYKADGVKTDGPYEYGSSGSQPDGVTHPYSDDSRTRQMPDGDTIHAFREVPEDLSKMFRAEIFFMAPDKQSRVCLLPLYDKEGKAWWVLGNREVSWNPEDRPSIWSASNDVSRDRSPPTSKLTGVEKIMSADLLLGEMVGTWKGYEHPVGKPLTGTVLPGSEYEVLHFPDGLSLCFPKFVKRGMGAFHLSAHWVVNEKRVHQASAVYSESGKFESYRTAHYTR